MTKQEQRDKERALLKDNLYKAADNLLKIDEEIDDLKFQIKNLRSKRLQYVSTRNVSIRRMRDLDLIENQETETQ